MKPLMSTLKSATAALGTVALCGLSTAWAAPANAEEEKETKLSENQTVIVIDASSSMAEPDGEGTKMDSAIKAANKLIDNLPESTQLGLVAYGSKVPSTPENHEKGCQDVTILSKVKGIDKDAMKKEISGLKATGYTPIGNALTEAAELLDGEGERSIILVSDGLDTCAPPPVCEVAQDLAKQGVGLKVHTIGFRVDEEAEKELACIADKTGGTTHRADNADELAEKLDFLARRDVNTYSTEGTKFKFSESKEDAPYLGEGTYRTKILPRAGRNEAEDRPFYFKLSVPKGYNAFATVMPIPPQSEEGKKVSDILYDVKASNPNPNCGYGYLSQSDYHGDNIFNEMVSHSVGIFNAKEHGTFDPCLSMDDWYVSNVIGYTGNQVGISQDEEIEVEINVQFQKLGKYADSDQEPYKGRNVAKEAPLDKPEKELQGGNSFGNAVEIEPGVVYSTNVVPGERSFFKFDVPWGKRPLVTIQTLADEENNGRYVTNGYALLYDAYRFTQDRQGFNFNGSSGDLERAFIEERTQFANAGEIGSPPSNAGDFYLGFSSQSNEERQGIEQEVSFKLELDGEPMDGPDWRPSFKPGAEASTKPINLASGYVDPNGKKSESSEAPTSKEESKSDYADKDKDTDTSKTAAMSEKDSGGWKGPLAGIAVIVLILGGLGAFLIPKMRKKNTQ